MDVLVERVDNLSLEDSKGILIQFIKDNEKTIAFPQFEDSVREKFWSTLFKQVDGDDSSTKLLCLTAIRILSREKFNLSAYVTEERLKKVFDISNISNDSECNDDCSIEALKCLCNITYNVSSVSEHLSNFGAPSFLAKRLFCFKGKSELNERKLFEIKLLFLITALFVPTRQALFDEYGLTFFIDLCLAESNIPKENISSPKRKKMDLDDFQLKILCEILRTVFNIMCTVKAEGNDQQDFKKFISILRELSLSCLTPAADSLLRDIVNVLTLMPNEYLDSLVIPGTKMSEKNVHKCPSMEAVSVYINFLDVTLVKIEEIDGTLKEELSPILLLLTNLAKCNKQFRKYIRCRVLPNLKEIYTRPEVGNTLRNKLCRLLTCPITSTRDLVADFLFVLCKESVGRMVKYTGYGNAAGLFANRGLLAGDPQARTSSESEGSETEEYSQNKHIINPIVGCLTPPRVDPTQDMTEEQKEILAMELVNKIDKLQRDGVIQPCRIGPDGKPMPICHVLELQECLPPPPNSKE